MSLIDSLVRWTTLRSNKHGGSLDRAEHVLFPGLLQIKQRAMPVSGRHHSTLTRKGKGK